MTASKPTTSTPFGALDSAALQEATQNFNTGQLLQMVDELDAFVDLARREGGLRDGLLRLHSMAQTVLLGAGLSTPAGDSLVDMACEIETDVREATAVLSAWLPQLIALQGLNEQA
ncbi:MAG: hypothetical protein EKK47_17500 [Burkholderiales bacterium]|nr:MAG: hypothetical protein EKK47_17500 [Burkholderiales bacterium]